MMTEGFEGRTTGLADDPDEDTIELELTREQVLGLAQAARAAHTTAPAAESTPGSASPGPPPAKPRLQARGATRFSLWSLTRIAAIVGITAVITWAAAQRAAERDSSRPAATSRAAAVTSAAPIVAAPAARAESPGPAVQVRNPFDATEVFEFPANTSESAAREAMAELLLQRARDRRHGIGTQRAGSTHPARGAAGENPATAAAR
jgi:hypothetical protein